MNQFIMLEIDGLRFGNWILFFGRFHPLIVHLPIGFLLIAGLLEIDKRINQRDGYNLIIRIILLWSAVGATFACILGYLLSMGGGYESRTLNLHMWGGIGVAALAWLARGVKSGVFQGYMPSLKKMYLPILTLSIILLMVAGHLGGNLTHGDDYLTRYMPPMLRKAVGLPDEKSLPGTEIKDINKALVYRQIVGPILESRCTQCHNQTKSKAGLRLDTPEMIMKGSKDGKVIIAGNVSESNLLKVCLLPHEDERHMPPKGKPQLSQEQVSIIAWWIEQGAPFDMIVSDLKISTDIRSALVSLTQNKQSVSDSAMVQTSSAAESEVLTQKVAKADPKVIDQLKGAGFFVNTISQGRNQVEVSAVNAANFGDEQAGLLLRVSEQTVWLKLGNTKISDVGLEQIGKMKNIQKLHLEQTAITDAGLRHLKNLEYLEYLNLYGTAVSDIGLMELSHLKNLKMLYIWKTKVTRQGEVNFKKASPSVEIIGQMTEREMAVAVDKEKRMR
ncbi:MAG: ribonuclease inhibitor [Candidatus Nephrothrix sp. EaCA]|nr:MAG: ribonuclease inhibitor [Candidatus Nephrothrix sp. EaCA]